MVDVNDLDYSVTVIGEKRTRYSIKQYIENLGWEESKNELAARITFTVRDSETEAGYLSKIIKPGCTVIIRASCGGGKKEVVRGSVVTWNAMKSNAGRELKVTAYDILYNLQQSQDNYFIASGTGTKAAVRNLLKRWDIPLGLYKGPDVKSGRKNYKNKYLADILRSILNNAVKKGGKKCIIRSVKGRLQVVPRGSNETVYVFDNTNSISVARGISTADMVTRVRVYGKESKNKKRPVIATVDGRTEFGIRQRIYQSGPEESTGDAKKAAQAILDKEGGTDVDKKVIAADVPFVRKGDRIYMDSGYTRGYFYVSGVCHNADNRTMTMEISKVKEKKKSAGKGKKEYHAGDTVHFMGGKHYVSSWAGAKGYAAGAGMAKITKGPDCAGNGKAHPWHLVHTDKKSNVYGWVDDGTFE